MIKPVIAVVLLATACFSVSAYAQVDVVDSAPVARTPPITGNQPATDNGSTNAQAEIFHQLQVLQQEVLTLRGLVEEQAYELKRLKQQRLDDYLDLDRRLSALGSVTKPPVAAVDGEAGATGKTEAALVRPSGAQSGELQQYRRAIDLVLKQKDYDSAISELDKYLRSYPQGRYAANAIYWQGEIYLLKNDLKQARQWFTRLLDGFGGHNKAPDAKFKLGKVYDLLGNKEKAKVLLEEVAASSADAARLARNYLAENF